MKKNSDKSHSSIGMFPHRFGRFLPSVTHLASEKLILPNFSMLRGVAVSVCFPEVRNRKQTESGLVLLDFLHTYASASAVWLLTSSEPLFTVVNCYSNSLGWLKNIFHCTFLAALPVSKVKIWSNFIVVFTVFIKHVTLSSAKKILWSYLGRARVKMLATYLAAK